MLRSFAVRIWLSSFTALIVMVVYSPLVNGRERVYVQAVDERTGRVVTNLRRDEVLVRESGIWREVLTVRPANLPIKLTVLVDNGSAITRSFDYLQEGLRVFFSQLPPNQEMSLVTLAPEPRWVVTETLDREEIYRGIDLIEGVEAPVRFLDGVIAASNRIDTDRTLHRPVIVIVTGNGGDASRDLLNRWEPLLDQVYRNGATIHTLLMSGRRQVFQRRSFREVAGLDFARLTGGYYRLIYVGSSLNAPLIDIAEEIRARSQELASQHLVVYERSADDFPENARVTLTRMGVRVTRVTPDGKLR